MRLAVGILGRIAFWIGLVVIVGHSALLSYANRDYVMLALKLVFFPLTYFLHPWTSGLWWIFAISACGYVVSTLVGRLAPVE